MWAFLSFAALFVVTSNACLCGTECLTDSGWLGLCQKDGTCQQIVVSLQECSDHCSSPLFANCGACTSQGCSWSGAECYNDGQLCNNPGCANEPDECPGAIVPVVLPPTSERDVCPWLVSTGTDFFECNDHTLQPGPIFNDPNSPLWGACNDHGGRKKCPVRFPVMCARPNSCASGQDYCCEPTAEECDKLELAGPRVCEESVCPFLMTTGTFQVECNDGTFCDVPFTAGDSPQWSCCNEHGHRKRCPVQWPVMCSDPTACASGEDYCCEESAAACVNLGVGEKRECTEEVCAIGNSGRVNDAECNDGTFCAIAIGQITNDEMQKCCDDHGFRKRCPASLPIQCECAERWEDFCCVASASECERLHDTYPKRCEHEESCMWLERNHLTFSSEMLCNDGTSCFIPADADPNSFLWGCCNEHGHRKLCPATWPVMCDTPNACAGSQDFCCEKSADECRDLDAGGPRMCSEGVCEFLTTTGTRQLQCNDGTFCSVPTTTEDSDAWSCCNDHGKRMHCPATWPVMCAQPNACAGGEDFCCEASEQSCTDLGYGGDRDCNAVFEECPHDTNTGTVEFECNDGTFCEAPIGYDGDSDKWSCCNDHGLRKRCPATWPVMCAKKEACAGGQDYCCEESATACELAGLGGHRLTCEEEGDCATWFETFNCGTTAQALPGSTMCTDRLGNKAKCTAAQCCQSAIPVVNAASLASLQALYQFNQLAELQAIAQSQQFDNYWLQTTLFQANQQSGYYVQQQLMFGPVHQHHHHHGGHYGYGY